VFLLDGQREAACSAGAVDDDEQDDDRSYVLLLFPPGGGSDDGAGVLRVEYRALLVGLLAQQMLLQAVGALLLRGSCLVVPSLANVLLQPPDVSPASTPATETRALPGLMRHLSAEHLDVILAALDVSYYAAVQFDARPGLKFLVQKVAGLDTAANLYRQAAAAWTIKVVALLELSLDEIASGQPGAALFRLRTAFDALCDAYVDVVLDRDGVHSASDKVCDQPIFFFATQAGDFPELRRKCDLRRAGDEDTSVPEAEEGTTGTADEGTQVPGPGDADGEPGSDDGESSGREDVYGVATEKDIDSLMEEYKRHKVSSLPFP